MVMHLAGSFEGKINDWMMMMESGLEEYLKKVSLQSLLLVISLIMNIGYGNAF